MGGSTCKNCNQDEFELSGHVDYDGLCLACEANEIQIALYESWDKEISEYNTEFNTDIENLDDLFDRCVSGLIPNLMPDKYPNIFSVYKNAVRYREETYWDGQLKLF